MSGTRQPDSNEMEITDTEEKAKLATQGLTKRFGQVVAVDNVNLSVPAGELRAIIGPNGAGKTTLFNTIAGTLSPTAGDIYFNDENITSLPTEERSQHGIARSYQSNQLFFEATVLENVRLAAQTASLGTFSFDMFSRAAEFKDDQANQIIKRIGLAGERNTKAKNLSHGDQRRLGIAVALATNPDTLLLDEPTSGMGSEATRRTANLISEIHDEFDLTVLMIEHDMSVVLSISDQISVLHRGSLLTTGPPEEVRENEAVQEAYLGGIKEEEI